MDSLVERLRHLELRIASGANETCGEAADRIEKLEKALREISGIAVCLSITGANDWPDMLQAIYAVAEEMEQKP